MFGEQQRFVLIASFISSHIPLEENAISQAKKHKKEIRYLEQSYFELTASKTVLQDTSFQTLKNYSKSLLNNSNNVQRN